MKKKTKVIGNEENIITEQRNKHINEFVMLLIAAVLGAFMSLYLTNIYQTKKTLLNDPMEDLFAIL